MKFLNESWLDTTPSIFIFDLITLLCCIITLLFILLECIFHEGSFRVQTPHVIAYYMGMYSIGYLLGRYLFM